VEHNDILKILKLILNTEILIIYVVNIYLYQ